MNTGTFIIINDKSTLNDKILENFKSAIKQEKIFQEGQELKIKNW